jgi:hypothetical protein
VLFFENLEPVALGRGPNVTRSQASPALDIFKLPTKRECDASITKSFKQNKKRRLQKMPGAAPVFT